MRRPRYNQLARIICLSAACTLAACGQDDANGLDPNEASSPDASDGSADSSSPDAMFDGTTGLADGSDFADVEDPEADTVVQSRNLSSREWLVASQFDELKLQIVAEPGAEPFSGDGTLDMGIVRAGLSEIFGDTGVKMTFPEGLVSVDAVTLPDASTLADIDATVRPEFDTLRERTAHLYIIYIADFLRDGQGDADEHLIAAPVGNAPGWVIVSKPAARAHYAPDDLDAAMVEHVAILHAFADSLRLYDPTTGTAAFLDETDDVSGMHSTTEGSITAGTWHDGEAQQEYIRAWLTTLGPAVQASTHFSTAELSAIARLRAR